MIQDAYVAMHVSVLITQKLKSKTTHSRRYLSRAYPLKEDEVEKNILWIA